MNNKFCVLRINIYTLLIKIKLFSQTKPHIKKNIKTKILIN